MSYLWPFETTVIFFRTCALYWNKRTLNMQIKVWEIVGLCEYKK